MSDNLILSAALELAGRGWPVHPVSPQHKRPLLAKTKDNAGKPVNGTGWKAQASTDAATIAGWWAKWPKAMIGLATGFERLFVVDFDPRVDAATGEEFTLERLKSDLETQMGCALPVSVTAVTQSGGVHVYFLWPDDGGAPIGNRGNLPEHVDVRGAGGYVVAPPSLMATGARYRWLEGKSPADIDVVEAPAELIAILRTPGKAAGAAAATVSKTETVRPAQRAAVSGDDPVAAARRKYALAALDNICVRIRAAGSGTRNAALNSGAFAAAQLVAAGILDHSIARASVEAAARDNAGRDDAAQLAATIDSGWQAGEAQPFDVSEIGVNAGRGGRGSVIRNHRTTETGAEATAGHPRTPAGSATSNGPNGRVADLEQFAGVVAEGVEGAQLKAVSAGWFARAGARLFTLRSVGREAVDAETGEVSTESAFEVDLNDGVTGDALSRFVWQVGSRVAADMLDEHKAAAVVAAIGFAVDDAGASLGKTGADLAKAFEDGMGRPFDPRGMIIDMRCAVLPKTDLGNAERFNLRHGGNYKYTTAKGWMGWTGTHWAVLDQEQDKTPAEVMGAVFDTVRAIQREAKLVADSGFRGADTGGMNRLWIVGKREYIESEELAKFGRVSEGSGRLSSVPNLAKSWFTVQVERFDADDFAINCQNGTLRLKREKDDAGQARAFWRLDPHERGDLISKCAPVEWQPKADAPIYDAMFIWAQPDAARRRYLHQWGGYSMSGHVGAQILHFWYGLGANGKSTVIDAWAGALGDYSGTIGIETFLDQGIKKRGEAASPDLARLGGVRLLRASEPEQNATLNEALIKAATGGEPMAVRALHKGFFDLRPQFKLTIGGNHKPSIRGTDEGIWRRLKLVPWESYLEEGQRDAELPNKLKAEFPGIFARLVFGLLDWMENGFVEPDSVKAATAEYREDSDPLGRFLRDCTRPAPEKRVQSSVLFNLFEAWAKATGATVWTNKGFSKAMKAKGLRNKTSNGVQWLDIEMTRVPEDFVDENGKVRDLSHLDDDRAGVAGAMVLPAAQVDDDGFGGFDD